MLYRGDYCNPLEPAESNNKENPNEVHISPNDQIIKICEKKILNEENDFSFLTNETYLEYLKQINGMTTDKVCKSLKELFPKTSDALLNLLIEMTEFNPYYRPTAKSLLKNNIFDQIRESKIENLNVEKIEINLDMDKHQLDYENEDQWHIIKDDVK